MDTERPLFYEDEYILLTQNYRDIPAGSVGKVSAIYPTHPPSYRVDFGPSYSRGPIPETKLTRLGRLLELKRG